MKKINMSKRETELNSDLCKLFNKTLGCVARKKHGSAFSRSEADLTICFQGVMIMIECKKDGNECTPDQMASLVRWSEAGAFSYVWTYTSEGVSYFNINAKECVRNFKIDALGSKSQVYDAAIDRLLNDSFVEHRKFYAVGEPN